MARSKFKPDAPFQPISGAAYLTGLSASYIRRGCKNGSIPHVRIGADYRVNMILWLAQLEARSTQLGGDNNA